MIPLAIVATRVDEDTRELLEIAVLRVDPGDGATTDAFVAAVRSPRAGSRHDRGALWLVDVMDRLRHLTQGCALVAWEGANTRQLLEQQCDAWELLPLELAPSTIDVRSLTWPLVLTGEAPRTGLLDVAAAMGVAPGVGSLLAEVQALATLHRLVVERAAASRTLGELGADERAIVETIVARIRAGRSTYREWRVDDGRKYPREALEEVMDALNYCAAELVRLGKRGAA